MPQKKKPTLPPMDVMRGEKTVSEPKPQPKTCPLRLAMMHIPGEYVFPYCDAGCAWFDTSIWVNNEQGGCVLHQIAESLEQIWSRMPQV